MTAMLYALIQWFVEKNVADWQNPDYGPYHCLWKQIISEVAIFLEHLHEHLVNSRFLLEHIYFYFMYVHNECYINSYFFINFLLSFISFLLILMRSFDHFQ